MPGADMDLAIALLRGWVAPCPEAGTRTIARMVEESLPDLHADD